MRTKLLPLFLLAGTSVFARGHISVGIGIGGWGYGGGYGGYYAPAPPPVAYYAPPPCPGPDYSWVSGYWYPVGPRYSWRAGYWARRPYPRAYRVGPRYYGPRYYRGYERGYWRR